MNFTSVFVVRKQHTPMIVLILPTYCHRIGLPICCECTTAVAEIWCKDCENKDCDGNYCDKCSTDTHRRRASERHQRVSMKDKPVELKRCKEHPDERLRYWCSCEALICRDCQISKQHRGHTPVLITEVVEDITKKVCTQRFIR